MPGFVVGAALATTGTDATTPLLFGGFLVLAGGIAFVLSRRFRRGIRAS